ncbi:MAG: AMP-binding protein [bacterium]|nr:AMP-binding protein [bacterium]
MTTQNKNTETFDAKMKYSILREDMIPPVEKKDYYQLSSSQKRIYFLQQIDTSGIAYNMPSATLLQGAVSREKAAEVFARLLQRHEGLRTSFHTVGEVPVQRVAVSANLSLNYMEAGEKDIADIIARYVKPFDLTRAPLMRVCLVKTGELNYALITDMHNIIADDVSQHILLEECFALLQDRTPEAPGIHYKDYAEWRNQPDRQKEREAQAGYWLKLFSDDFPKLELPTDFPRPPVKSFAGTVYPFSIPPTDAFAFMKLAEELSVSLFMNFLTLFNLLLYRYTGQEDIIVGSHIRDRSPNMPNNIIGSFINTPALRNYPSGDKTYLKLLDEIKVSTLEALDNQDAQFDEVVDKLGLERDPARSPLFDVSFTFKRMSKKNDVPMEDDAGIHGVNGTGDFTDATELQTTPYAVAHQTSLYDLSLIVTEKDGDIFPIFRYASALFKEETIKRIADHFLRLLGEVVRIGGSRSSLAELEMLDEKEKEQLLFRFNDSKRDVVRDRCYQHLFEEQAARVPGRLAAQYERETVTYRELNTQANRIAATLAARGVKPGSIIAVFMKRSIKMLAAILGTFKVGCAYMPIDIYYPMERVRKILENSETPVVITDRPGKIIQLKESSHTGRDPHHMGTGAEQTERGAPECLEHIISPLEYGDAYHLPDEHEGSVSADTKAYLVSHRGKKEKGNPKSGRDAHSHPVGREQRQQRRE